MVGYIRVSPWKKGDGIGFHEGDTSMVTGRQ
jgi:hypothetical protein